MTIFKVVVYGFMKLYLILEKTVKSKILIQLCMIPVLLAMLSPAYARVIKIATISPDGTFWMQEMRAGAKEIKKQTQGRVVLKFYPGGVMGNDANVLRKIRIGQLQGGAVTAGSLSGIYPDIDIYGLPYLFSSYEQVDSVRSKMDKMLINGLEKKGFVGFGLAEGGFTYMMSDSQLRTVEDVKSKKVWIPSGNKVGEAVFGSASIAPVTLPLSDVLTGLQTGLINTVIISPIGAIALQWHTRVKYMVDDPLTYVSALLVIDKKIFNKIKKKDREIVREIMSKAFDRIDHQNRKDNIAARDALKKQGIEFISLSKDVLNDWRTIAKKAIKVLEEKNRYSDDAYNQIMKNIKIAGSAHP